MEITCSYSEEILNQSLKDIKKNQLKSDHPKIKKALIIGGVLFLGCIITSVILMILQPIVALIFLILLIMMIRSIVTINRKKGSLSFFESHDYQTITYEISPDGLKSVSKNVEGFRNWNNIKKIYSGENTICFYITTGSAIPIPKREFPSENECEKFYISAKKYWLDYSQNEKKLELQN